MMIEFITQAALPTQFGDFDVHVFTDQGQEHLVLSRGLQAGGHVDDSVLLRVHSECLTGDGLFSLRCDCGPQLAFAMENIGQQEQGMIIYLRQEGRGIGLVEKIKAYELQDQGEDTVSANLKLGHPADGRSYDMVGPVLQHFGISQVCLMTNNPSKIEALQAQNITVSERVPIRIGENPHNQAYLRTKSEHMRHMD
ncbi:GTP cyclohydrolase II [Marinicella sp. W31]|uniref:GTP cyclohydrolase II n=1 Tax=Marinicella sp. W31 TaxID=3023713 RepID=UPI00375805C6